MIVDDIYEEFEDWLKRFALGLAHDGDRADDLVQDTMIRALANLHLLESMGHYQRRSWLRRTLKNLFIDEYRSFGRQRSLIESLSSDTVTTGDISEPRRACSSEATPSSSRSGKNSIKSIFRPGTLNRTKFRICWSASRNRLAMSNAP